MDLSRLRLAAGIAGPAAFVGAWVAGSVVKDGYSPVSDAISRLAEQGASTAPLMTSGFVAYGVLMPVFARELPAGARAAVTVSGLGTLAVAAFPVTPDSGHLIDKLHAASAAASYAANALAPVLAARAFGGRRRAAGVSGLIAACLVGSVAWEDGTGLLQRAGLTIFDAWAVTTAWRLLRSSDTGVDLPA